MTAAEMKLQFLAQYDAATSLSAPGWEDDEISSFINKATKDIITELYNKKELVHLSNLILTKTNLALTTATGITNASYCDIHSYSYLYFLTGRLKLTRTVSPIITVGEYIPSEEIDETVAPKFFQTAFNKVWFRYPKCYLRTPFVNPNGFTYSTLMFLYDSYTTPLYGEFTYISVPVSVDIAGGVDSNMNEVLHKDIIDKAVEEAVKSIKVAKITNQ